MAVELLALKVKQTKGIKGIKMQGWDIAQLIKQYADDITFLLKDLIDFREILSKIKSFSEISGLQINKNKSFATSLGKMRNDINEYLGIKFVKSVKILGVYFSAEIPAAQNPQNWDDKILKLEQILKQ